MEGNGTSDTIFERGPSNPKLVDELGSDVDGVLGPTQWEPSMAYEGPYCVVAPDAAATAQLQYPLGGGKGLETSHRGYVMEHDRITYQGSALDLLADLGVRRAFLGAR